MKNAIVEFKLWFLLCLSTKSRFQTLRGYGNECRRGWNREIREGRCLNRSIGLISNSNALQIGGTPLFIGHFGVTVRSKRSTITMKRSIVDRVDYVAAVGSLMEHMDEAFDMRYKIPWIEMHPHIITININMHVTSRRVGAAWARAALPRGLVCIVTSTWVPRENKTRFFLLSLLF